MHGGTIKAESEKDKGTRITVTLPVSHTDEKESRNEHYNHIESDALLELEEIETESAEADSDKPVMLVIDDNKDIRQLIGEIMGDEYNVIYASNGRIGVKLATKYIPDIIICDIMMPVMDGLECCRILKNEDSTSHIPVIILTACSMDEQRYEGYESGADGYLSKPFSGDVLRARCRNLMENRRRIENLYGNRDHEPVRTAEPAGDRTAKPRNVSADMESEFYNRFIEIVKEELGNSALTIEDIAGKMNIGRSQLGRKIKALTNYAPVEIIRNMRLREAKRLLTTTEKSVGEIAYEVGFHLPAYFSKCYKDAFGESPTDLRNRLSKEK